MRSEVRGLGGKAAGAPPFCAEVRNKWSHTCVPPRWFHGMERGSFASPYSFSKVLRSVTIVMLLLESAPCTARLERNFMRLRSIMWFWLPCHDVKFQAGVSPNEVFC